MQFFPNLPVGGAERMMVSLAKGLDHDRYDVRALTFFHEPTSPMVQELRESGVELMTLGKHRGFDPRMISRVAFALRTLRPDILHTHRAVFPYALPTVITGRLRGGVEPDEDPKKCLQVGCRCIHSTRWLSMRQDSENGAGGARSGDPSPVPPWAR